MTEQPGGPNTQQETLTNADGLSEKPDDQSRPQNQTKREESQKKKPDPNDPLGYLDVERH